jgi:amino acid transporter
MLINAMVGAGLLAAPARVFGLVGDWGFLVLAAAGAIIAPLVLCFADLGSRFQGTGGPYLYARAALPGWVAFSVGWLIWASQGLAVATLCNLLIDYLSGSAPWVSQDGPRAAIIVILGLGFTAIVLAGIGPSTRVGNVLAGIKVVFVVGFALAAAAFIRPENLAAASPPPAPLDFAQALLVYLFAYTGFERASILAGEARDPQRDVPIALIASVAGVTLLYAAVLAACQGVLGDPSATDRPLAEAWSGPDHGGRAGGDPGDPTEHRHFNASAYPGAGGERPAPSAAGRRQCALAHAPLGDPTVLGRRFRRGAEQRPPGQPDHFDGGAGRRLHPVLCGVVAARGPDGCARTAV